MTGFVDGFDVVLHEVMLFAAFGFLIGGIDDLLVDAIYAVVRVGRAAPSRLAMQDLPASPHAGRLAVFVAAWDEVAVIGDMLTSAFARYDHPDYRLYVGTYPNDPGTVEAVARIARTEPRLRHVILPHGGPTTKADCLNVVWAAMVADDARDGPTRAVVLHDAEDLVHPLELQVVDRLIDRHAVVQIPVLPLISRHGRLVSGTYADEFAESHGKQLVVRGALGAGLPLAGVGCAIATPMLARIAAMRGGKPFDSESLTEDYELGLRIAELGGRGIFARVEESPGGPVVATRAYFPDSVGAAVRQKARWMIGIALAGWDRTGWARARAIGDHWMRMRDRRAPLAILVMATAYLSMVLWAVSLLLHLATGSAVPSPGPWLGWLAGTNAALLGWRLAMRMAFTTRVYGPREGLWAIPRLLVGNYIALFAARRAVIRYIAMLRGAPPVWDKTAHAFPDDVQAIAGS
ncbi:glycosyl transferase family protein [Sphingomonas sp. Leaf17]|uniref:glycosyl transferase family protein n=1 Tax=Sphingomonas sp. Leaf17 TaxID=1735683 RepID=UPI0009E79536|nr:glycosyl transferase family protein [Sphingomonas sp. Leaf17]